MQTWLNLKKHYAEFLQRSQNKGVYYGIYLYEVLELAKLIHSNIIEVQLL